MSSARQITIVGWLALAAITGCRHAPPPLVQTQAPTIITSKPAPPPDGNPLSTQSSPPLPSLPPVTEDASAHAPKPPKPRRHRKPKPLLAGSPAAPGLTAQNTPASGANPAHPTSAGTTSPSTTPALSTASAAPAPQSPPPALGDISPIGSLSTTDVSAGTTTRRSVVELIAGTDSALSNLRGTLTAGELETASQVRSFLQKARAALDSDDLDGAHILATKARVLLNELTKD